MASWLTYASVDLEETAALLNRLLLNGHEVVRSDHPNHLRLWYKDIGELAPTLDESPVVLFFPPCKLADHLWTIGRFFFPQTHLQKKYPKLSKIKKAIAEELQTGVLLWHWKRPQEGDFRYYLEGSIMNHDYQLYGMPSSLPYLKEEGYFIEGEETPVMLEKLRTRLALRGVEI